MNQENLYSTEERKIEKTPGWEPSSSSREKSPRCRNLSSPSPSSSVLLPGNQIRDFSSFFSPWLKKTIGNYYYILHYIIILLGCFVVLFSQHVGYLCIILNMIILDCISIIFIHDCPLTMLERKYLGSCSVTERQYFLKNSNICYQCGHEYESQLELLINLWCLVALKIFYKITMNIFGLTIHV